MYWISIHFDIRSKHDCYTSVLQARRTYIERDKGNKRLKFPQTKIEIVNCIKSFNLVYHLITFKGHEFCVCFCKEKWMDLMYYSFKQKFLRLCYHSNTLTHHSKFKFCCRLCID